MKLVSQERTKIRLILKVLAMLYANINKRLIGSGRILPQVGQDRIRKEHIIMDR